MYQLKRWLVIILTVCVLSFALVDTAAGQDRETQINEALRLNKLSVTLLNEGRYHEAIPLAKRALEIIEPILGPHHPELAILIKNLATLYDYIDDDTQAEPLYRRALEILEDVLGADHPDIAPILNSLGSLLRDKGDYRQAEILHQRARFILEEAPNANQIVVADTLNYLAILSYIKADYSQAESLGQRALKIREEVLGPNHRDVAASLGSLALTYRAKGNFKQAVLLQKRAVEVAEKALGPEELEVAAMLNNLASLYDYTGEYTQAEPLYKRALKITVKALGAQHPNVAMLLNNLALMYHGRGANGEAELLQKRAMEILEKARGKDHPDVATLLGGLAKLNLIKGDYVQAEQLYKRAIGIVEKALGVDHPDTARANNNLAEFYRAREDYVQAKPLYTRALSIFEKALGPDHPAVAMTLNNLAELYKDQGEYTQAEQLLKRAFSILEKALGVDHPYVANSLINLGALYFAKDDQVSAVQFLTRGIEIEERNLRLILAIGSENQKQLYINTISGATHLAVSLHVRAAPRDEQAARLALTTILQRKGRVLDAMTDQIGALRRNATLQDKELFDRLAATRAQFVALQLSGDGRLSPEGRRTQLAKLYAELERLEGEASRRSMVFRAQQLPITLDAVRQAIPADAALVEIFSYTTINFATRKFDPRRYVAYVLRRGEAVPQWVELGEVAQIDEAAVRWRRALGNPPLRKKGEQISDAVLRERLAKHEAEVKVLARALDERVMQPVRELLGQTRRVFLSPDGNLNLIPFAALVDEDGKYLIENYSLTYLTSGRDLLRLQVQTEDRSAPVVVANPLYDLTAASGPKSAIQPTGETEANRRSTDFTLKTYAPLPGTMEEASALAKLLPVGTRVFLQEQATEAALKQVDRPRVLHIATHGYFLSNQPQALPTGNNPVRETSDTFKTSSLPAGWENALLRSGLILAGVKQQSSGANEDGVLTALEMAGMDLWGTRLVVLSACETGLGDVKNGEGVYGLRRALVLAGSETQVMSLWKVSDAGTRDLMTSYYKRLQAGEGRTEALRVVQLGMLRGKLSAATSGGKRGTIDTGEGGATKDYRHPYYWAAFIQSGDWRSMDGK